MRAHKARYVLHVGQIDFFWGGGGGGGITTLLMQDDVPTKSFVIMVPINSIVFTGADQILVLVYQSHKNCPD